MLRSAVRPRPCPPLDAHRSSSRTFTGVDRHGFIAAVHERYRPRSYLEIGVDEGAGLAQSRTRTIGVDPAFGITSELACDLQLVRATSDDFFARPDALAWFAEDVIDFS